MLSKPLRYQMPNPDQGPTARTWILPPTPVRGRNTRPVLCHRPPIMKILPLICSSSVLLSLAACSSGGLSHRVDADMVSGVPEARQSQLSALDEALETSRGEKTKSERDLALATYELEKAEQNRQLVANRIDHMNGLKDAADKLEDAIRVADAENVIEGLDALLEAHDEEIEWLEAEVEYYEVGIELAESKVNVADAQVMVARAEAIHRADLPEKAEYPLLEFKLQLSEKTALAAEMEVVSAKAWKSAQEEKGEFQEALAAVTDDAGHEEKALSAAANKNNEMADEMNALRKQVKRLQGDNDRLQTTLVGGTLDSSKTGDAGNADDKVNDDD